MISNFQFTPSIEDYSNYQKFKLKITKSAGFTYIVCLFMIGFSAYTTASTKNYFYLVSGIIVTLIFILLELYKKNGKVQRYIKKAKKYDKNFFQKTDVSVFESALEIKVGEENEPSLDAVYPFSAMIAIFESRYSFYFVITGDDTVIIPKIATKPQEIEKISLHLKKIPNYKFVN